MPSRRSLLSKHCWTGFRRRAENPRFAAYVEVDLITLYGFGRIFPEGHGETKDLWVQWALEESGLPYRVHALDHTGGELDGAAYRHISPFRQAPVIVDEGFVVAESAAIVLYLAEKAGKLIPDDVQGRTRVVQWCFAAVSTVGTTLVCLDLIGMFDSGQAAPRLHTEMRKLAGRWLSDVEGRLAGREWIACADFTVADIMMSCVLRGIRKTDLMEPYPMVKAYYERCIARPAWQRALTLYAERLGVNVDDIR
jgi:glutathione S-transferase